jgi:hypothetical protein
MMMLLKTYTGASSSRPVSRQSLKNRRHRFPEESLLGQFTPYCGGAFIG